MLTWIGWIEIYSGGCVVDQLYFSLKGELNYDKKYFNIVKWPAPTFSIQ